MLSRVERALGDDLRTTRIRADVQVTQQRAGYQARLRIEEDGRLGERTLDHPQCDVLADSVALVIALSQRAAGHDVDHDSAPAQLALAFSAHASAALGPLPKLALGAGASVALELPAIWRFELSGSYYVVQSASYPGLDIGADFRLFRVAARGCKAWRLGSLDLGPCLGVAWYRVAAAGFGGMQQQQGGANVWGPELSALARLRLTPRLYLQLSAAAALAVSRQRFTFSDLGLLHRPAAFACQLLVAPEVLF